MRRFDQDARANGTLSLLTKYGIRESQTLELSFSRIPLSVLIDASGQLLIMSHLQVGQPCLPTSRLALSAALRFVENQLAGYGYDKVSD